MEVIFLRSFLNDIKKLNDKKLKEKIKEFILELPTKKWTNFLSPYAAILNLLIIS